MREFEWNVVVDESIFSLDVPAGYKIAEQEADAGTTASDAFVKMLKFYVRLNDESVSRRNQQPPA